jgi:hypothetical protein
MYKGLTVTLAKVVPAVSISYVVRPTLLRLLNLPNPADRTLRPPSLRQRSTSTRNGNWGSRSPSSLPSSLLLAQLSIDTPPIPIITTISSLSLTPVRLHLPAFNPHLVLLYSPSPPRPTYTLFLYSQCSISSPSAGLLCPPESSPHLGLRERGHGCQPYLPCVDEERGATGARGPGSVERCERGREKGRSRLWQARSVSSLLLRTSLSVLLLAGGRRVLWILPLAFHSE